MLGAPVRTTALSLGAVRWDTAVPQWRSGGNRCSHTARQRSCVDANEATARVAYGMSDVAFVYPITPSTPMAHHVEQWSSADRRPTIVSRLPPPNAYATPLLLLPPEGRGFEPQRSRRSSEDKKSPSRVGRPLVVKQMQSEAGVAGACHGALLSGALATTFTSSQGLLLMLPELYKISGELLPLVVHVASRSVAGQGVTIQADHSDVYAAARSGCAVLCSHGVQDACEMSAVAHAAAVESRLPFLHFFEGMQVSHELSTVRELEEDFIAEKLVPWEHIAKFRSSAATPSSPKAKGVVQGRDTYWQQQETGVGIMMRVPEIVKGVLMRLEGGTGRRHQLMEYEGARDAERVVVVMGAATHTVAETVRDMCSRGEKVGVLGIHLLRPWSTADFVNALPATTKKIAVLDRCGADTAASQLLYLDVAASLVSSGRHIPTVIAGRYGVGDKDFTPAHAAAVFEHLSQPFPKRHFTVGILDDVTHMSIPPSNKISSLKPAHCVECIFWGIGGDGTVGANRNATAIISKHTDLCTQGIFLFDAHKMRGVTVSHLRFGTTPQEKHYPIQEADFVSSSVPEYLSMYPDLLRSVKPNGTLLVNTNWSTQDFSSKLPSTIKHQIASKNINLFAIDASKIAEKLNLSGHTNNIMQAAFFKLSGVMPLEKALKSLKDAISESYARFGDDVVSKNIASVDAALDGIQKIEYPTKEWLSLDLGSHSQVPEDNSSIEKSILEPLKHMQSDLPVSTFVPYSGGWQPTGQTKHEKRAISSHVATWKNSSRCIQCNRCSFVCPHSAIRPFIFTEGQLQKAPESFKTIPVRDKTSVNASYRIQVSPDDCTGCNACIQACPTQCLSLEAVDEQTNKERENWAFASNHTNDPSIFTGTSSQRNTIKGSQLRKPLIEFAGACAGCAQPTYVKLLTQLFGERLVIANGIGCSTVWGGTAWNSPYTVDDKGRGPAWACSLFEDTAELGLGMMLGHSLQREQLQALITQALSSETVSPQLKAALQSWLSAKASPTEAEAAYERLLPLLETEKHGSEVLKQIYLLKDFFPRTTHWIVGGDGWAYDIGYGGLDHILASGEKINIMVLDNEVYANTGGQCSKSTHTGAYAKLASTGNTRNKKNLAQLAMCYPHVYVASVCYGADPAHAVRVLQEADSHPGPSLVLCYCPCMEHGIKGGGLVRALSQMKRAVSSGYWPLFVRDPGKGAQVSMDRRVQPPTEQQHGELEKFCSQECRFDPKCVPKIATHLNSTTAKLAASSTSTPVAPHKTD